MGLHWGSQFGGWRGKNTDKAPDCWLHIKESNGLHIPSNLLAFISQAHKNAQDKLRDMGIVDILHN